MPSSKWLILSFGPMAEDVLTLHTRCRQMEMARERLPLPLLFLRDVEDEDAHAAARSLPNGTLVGRPLQKPSRPGSLKPRTKFAQATRHLSATPDQQKRPRVASEPLYLQWRGRWDSNPRPPA